MIRQPISRRWQIGLGVSSVLLLVGLYCFLSYQRHSDNPKDKTVPSLSQLREALVLVSTPNKRTGEIWLWRDAKATFWRLVSGVAVGVLLSVVIGLLMGCYMPAEAFFLPPLVFLAKIPPTAMLAVFFVMVGTDYKMYVTMIAFGMLPTLAQAVHQAAKSDVPEELVFKAYTLGGTHAELIWNVIFQIILPRVLEAIRLQVGPAMVLLVAAEWMVAGEGFGHRLRIYYQRTDMTVVYVYLIVLGVVGYLIDYALTWTRRKLCPWFGS